MGYGSGYVERDYNQSIDEGDYEVILGMPVDTQKSGYDMRIIPITIIGHDNCYPKDWTWFDRPYDDENAIKWDKAMTKNADAFGVARGDFNPRSWAGKRGVVHIGKDKDGKYMKVLWAVPEASGEQATPTSKPVSMSKPVGSTDTTPTDFPDDIPF